MSLKVGDIAIVCSRIGVPAWDGRRVVVTSLSPSIFPEMVQVKSLDAWPNVDSTTGWGAAGCVVHFFEAELQRVPNGLERILEDIK